MSWPSLEDVLSCLVGSHKADGSDIRMITYEVYSLKKKIHDYHRGTNGYGFLNITNFPFSHWYDGEIFILLCFYTGFPFWSSLFLCPFNSLIYKFYLASSLHFSHLLFQNFHKLTLKTKTPIFLQNNSPSILKTCPLRVWYFFNCHCIPELWDSTASSRETVQHRTVLCCLTTGLHSEKLIIKWFCRCANITECTDTNLGGVAYHTPRLHGTACCS